MRSRVAELEAALLDMKTLLDDTSKRNLELISRLEVAELTLQPFAEAYQEWRDDPDILDPIALQDDFERAHSLLTKKAG